MSIRNTAGDRFCEDIDFTNAAMENMYDIVDRLDFSSGNEAEAIYQWLKYITEGISFSDYLKRYIYRKAGLEGKWRDISDNEYASIILYSFEDNITPISFEPTTVKRTAMVKNWLKQEYVSRRVVLILGFGLSMSVEDVDEFLTNVLKDTGLDPKNPFEVLCWYCYKNKLPYPVFSRLYTSVLNGIPGNETVPDLEDDTQKVCKIMYEIKTEKDLFTYINSLYKVSEDLKTGVTAKKEFDKLYIKVCESYAFKSGNEFEKKLYDSIPMGDHGNLAPVKYSALAEIFLEKRLTRQRISQIQADKARINRYDLITLNFLLYSRVTSLLPKRRYIEFVRDTNQILRKCGMGDIYAADPYESFIMICMLAESPSDTYAEVWGMSYEREENDY